jgi:hypothetical protein
MIKGDTTNEESTGVNKRKEGRKKGRKVTNNSVLVPSFVSEFVL